MDFLLPPERDDDIRLAIDPMLDGMEAIPTEVIRSAPYLGEAERWAVAVDPAYATRTGGELELFQLAIIYMTASLISLMVPQSRQVNLAGHTETFTFAETPRERADRLASVAAATIGAYLPVTIDPLSDAFIFVTTVSGRRA